MAWVEPISPTTLKSLRSSPTSASAFSSACREPDPRSRTMSGSARTSSSVAGFFPCPGCAAGTTRTRPPRLPHPPASLQDPLHDPLGIADEKRDGDVGVFLLEAADEGRQDVLAGDRAGGDNELPAHAALELVEGLARPAVERAR